jgi:uncharacterized repeat protein (TIGR03806 family)
MKLRKYAIILLVLLAPAIYVISCSNLGNPDIENDLRFENKLSYYKLFKGKITMLEPAPGIELLELSSTLFTDYAEKQRLIKLPAGKKVILKGNGLPIFPEGTLLAKTFFYESKSGTRDTKKILETRLLVFARAKWNVATYQWNEAQTEAYLIEKGAKVTVSLQDPYGRSRQIAYQIPSRGDCISCHHSENSILPIGPKARNLNRIVDRGEKQVNQLTYLMEKGLIEHAAITTVNSLPNYSNTNLPVEQRARAYLDINCAHCHQSGGYAGSTTINLDYDTSLDYSGIKLNKNNIVIRMNIMDEYHMPKLGTTVLDTGGLALVRAYILKIK